MKEFNYYIFVDYSENLVGYCIIQNEKLKELIPKISRFKHYKSAGNRRLYLKNVKNTIKREKIEDYFLKLKINEVRKNIEIYLDILEFLKKNTSCIIFVSVDNRQYNTFRKMVAIACGENVIIKRESELKVGTNEYQASLVLDNLLNIERLKE
ncbi:MAG: hypothetical protein AABX65_02735 [Nanoarchaeota archaeon]